MTKTDKERFDGIFLNSKHFEDVTDCDMIRSASECYKLYEYLSEDIPKNLIDSIPKYMHFAYWLGVITEKRRWQDGNS